MSEPEIRHLPRRERPAWLPDGATGYRVLSGTTVTQIVYFDATGPICTWCDTEIEAGAPFALVAICGHEPARYGHQACIRAWRQQQKEDA